MNKKVILVVVILLIILSTPLVFNPLLAVLVYIIPTLVVTGLLRFGLFLFKYDNEKSDYISLYFLLISYILWGYFVTIRFAPGPV